MESAACVICGFLGLLIGGVIGIVLSALLLAARDDPKSPIGHDAGSDPDKRP